MKKMMQWVMVNGQWSMVKGRRSKNSDFELVALRLVDAVFLQHARTTRAIAKTHDCAVNAKEGFSFVLQLVVVGLAGYVLS